MMPDTQLPLANLSVCLTVCAFNRTCAAVTYNRNESMCYMAGVPRVISLMLSTPRQATFVKRVKASDVQKWKHISTVDSEG